MWGEMGLDLSRLRLFVSEWGLDGAVGGNPYEGWRAFMARGEITEQQYIEDLVAGEAVARQYPWLLALFKFVYGWEKPWQTYNHDEGFVRNLVQAMGSVPGPAYLPENETATDAATLMQKVRWWSEEFARQIEAGNWDRAWAIWYSLIKLMYRAEQALTD